MTMSTFGLDGRDGRRRFRGPVDAEIARRASRTARRRESRIAGSGHREGDEWGTLFDGYVAASSKPKTGEAVRLGGKPASQLAPCRTRGEALPQSGIPQEVWKLSGVGSVGGQALLGIAALEGLRRRAGAAVWPFQTLGEGRAHVLAEMYPSLIEPERGSDVKDARQVRTWAAALRRVDSEGDLARHLSAAGKMPVAVREEEAAILGMDDPAAFQRMVDAPPARASRC